jgi:hypothetical protein
MVFLENRVWAFRLRPTCLAILVPSSKYSTWEQRDGRHGRFPDLALDMGLCDRLGMQLTVSRVETSRLLEYVL